MNTTTDHPMELVNPEKTEFKPEKQKPEKPEKQKKEKKEKQTKIENPEFATRKNKYGIQLEYSDKYSVEIGVDEAGRGPLFGRLYVAGVVLPKDGSFDISEMRDSKKITSKKKIVSLSEYIKEHALAWHIHFVEAEEIDEINIRQAVLKGMRICIREILLRLNEKCTTSNTFLLIDGNDFPGYTYFDSTSDQYVILPHETIPGGDNLYAAISCASILAKVERDKYITDLCEHHPELIERYKINQNMGYGTKHHLDGILEHGITQWHRKTYSRCK
jgi:ribonuclease HII